MLSQRYKQRYRGLLDYRNWAVHQGVARQQVHSVALRALPESALAKKKLLPFPLKYIQKITVAGNEALVQGKLWFVGQGEGGIISSSWVRGTDKSLINLQRNNC